MGTISLGDFAVAKLVYLTIKQLWHWAKALAMTQKKKDAKNADMVAANALLSTGCCV